MLGIVVELIVSWLLLRYVEGTDLLVLGIVPTKKRIGNLVFGIIASAITCAIYYLAIGYLARGNWTINAGFSFQSFLTWLVVVIKVSPFRGTHLQRRFTLHIDPKAWTDCRMLYFGRLFWYISLVLLQCLRRHFPNGHYTGDYRNSRPYVCFFIRVNEVALLADRATLRMEFDICNDIFQWTSG